MPSRSQTFSNKPASRATAKKSQSKKGGKKQTSKSTKTTQKGVKDTKITDNQNKDLVPSEASSTEEGEIPEEEEEYGRSFSRDILTSH